MAEDFVAPPTTARELRQRLLELHRSVGEPAAKDLREVGKGVDLPAMAGSSLSEFLGNQRPNSRLKQDFVRAFAGRCLLYAKTPHEAVLAELARWDSWWLSSIAESGLPPLTTLKQPQPRPEPKSVRRPLIRQAALVVVGMVAGVLIATGIAWVWPWTLFNSTPNLSTDVGRPGVGSRAADGCPYRSADVRDERDDTAGAVWYRECRDYLEIWTSDHQKDGRCVWAIVHWSNGATDTTSRACPAGRMEYSRVDRLTADYRIELVARTTG